MSAVCLADVIVAGERVTCGRPASDKSDPTWPLCGRCLGLKHDVDRRWGKKEPRR